MNKTIMTLVVAMLVLSACGGGGGGGKSPFTPTSSSLSSSSVSSASSASNVMVLNKEYPYTAKTKITNTGTTDLVVTKKHYWQDDKTVVILKDGSATID